MGKEGILLGFVETVNFIDKEDGASLEVPVLAGALDDRFDIFLAGSDGGDFDKVGFELMREDASEGGLAGAWWPPEDEVDGLAFFDNFG